MLYLGMREKAIDWWKELESENKQAYVVIVLMQPKRSYKTLTGREIEQIYKWEYERFN